MKRTLFSTSLLCLSLLFTACSDSSAPAKKAEPKKPAEPVSGQSGIFQMYQVVRTWAPDAMLLRVENGNIPEVAPQPGKYGVWRAIFASPSRSVKRDWTFAAADSEGIIKGVRAGSDTSFIPSKEIHRFAIQEVKVDTPAAYATAMKYIEKDKAMKKFLDENKDYPVQYLLEWTGMNSKPYWRVIFGPSVSQSKFSIFVNANTGEFVKKAN